MFSNCTKVGEDTYLTNANGDGLWKYSYNHLHGHHEYKQILGTCDFTVRGIKTRWGVVRKIRRAVEG